MRKLLVVCGPTATGKTSLGIRLARQFDGEIVSADSRQIYRGMDIITGKDLPVNSKFKILTADGGIPSKGGKNSKSQFKVKNFRIGYYDFDGVPLWLLDIVEPDYKFSVVDYYELAWKVIEDIWQRGKLPIIVGGTGFYIKALTEGIGTIGVEPDWELRKELSNCQIDELRTTLERLDPERFRGMNESDRQNPRRLVRAIEITVWKCEVRNEKIDKEVRSEKRELSHFPLQYSASHFQPHTSVLFIGLRAPFEVLYQRIDQRVEERVKMAAEEEIRKLLSKGYKWDNSVLGTTIGYREWRDYFEGKVSKEAVIQKWKFSEHNYCRRQMTWFKKNKKINWFDITKKDYRKEVEKLIENWYS